MDIAQRQPDRMDDRIISYYSEITLKRLFIIFPECTLLYTVIY